MAYITGEIYAKWMTTTPFRDMAKKVASSSDYMTMQVRCQRARSHGWWRNVCEYGPWEGPSGSHTGPPKPYQFEGIARLFKVSTDQVARMVAADWYGVPLDGQVSDRASRTVVKIESLSTADAKLAEALIDRLAEAGTPPTESDS
ncbi:hypothetical protein ACIRPK_06115 [Kitasatospora sp. NPDC101801]|uniref:hypothetical protein n=1 Tax=Kitasatospora sp. NPDC101801 TaxID=3364103 RepID=UPI003829856F